MHLTIRSTEKWRLLRGKDSRQLLNSKHSFRTNGEKEEFSLVFGHLHLVAVIPMSWAVLGLQITPVQQQPCARILSAVWEMSNSGLPRLTPMTACSSMPRGLPCGHIRARENWTLLLKMIQLWSLKSCVFTVQLSNEFFSNHIFNLIMFW